MDETTILALSYYEKHKIKPGSFLYFVLCNDLFEAVNRADNKNCHILKEICLYVFNNLPQESWGSKQKVDLWLLQ